MNTIAAFARDSLILCVRYRHLAPLCTTADHWFSHLAVSYDRFAICNPPALLRPLLDLWIEFLPASASIRPAPSGQFPQRPARPGEAEPSPGRGSGQ